MNLLLGVAGLVTSANADTFYVDATSGVDATGQSGLVGAPWKTLSYAKTRVPSGLGHIIHLNAGTHTVAGPLFIDPKIKIEGSGQATTTLKSTNSTGFILKFEASTNTDGSQGVSNLTLDGNNRANESGLYFQNLNNILVSNVTFNNFKDTALLLRGAGYNQGKNNRATGIEVSNATFNNCGADKPNSVFKSGVIMVGTTTGAKIHNVNINSPGIITHGIKYDYNAAGNELEGGWNFGLKIYDSTITLANPVDTPPFSVELFNAYNGCEVYNISTNQAISMGGQKDPTLNGDGTIDMRIYNNTMSGSASGGYQNSNWGMVEMQGGDFEVDHNYFKNPGYWGIPIWNEGDTSNRKNIFIHHNTFYAEDVAAGSDQRAITIEHPVAGQNIKIYNNTFQGRLRGVSVDTGASGTNSLTNIDIANNVFTDITAYWQALHLYGSGALSNARINNNVYTDSSKWIAGSMTGWTVANNFLSATPGLTKSGNRPDPYYRPSSSSSYVVDKGTTANLPTISYSGAAPDAGAYEWGGTSTPTPTPTVTPTPTPTVTPTPTPPTGTGTGLQGQYYSGMTLSTPVSSRIDPTVNFNWGTGTAMTSVGPDSFSVRWTGQVQAVESGTYTFKTTTDDGVRLWVNNTLLVDKWLTGATSSWTGTINLTADQQYPIKMEYFENAGDAVAQLSWTRPGQTTASIIPASQLYPTTTTKYEGEASANTITSPAYSASDSAASGGFMIKSLGNGTSAGTLQFNGVTVNAAGTYTLTIYHSSYNARSATMSINSGAGTTVSFPATTGIAAKTVTVNLNAGSNTIKFSGTSWIPDIDCITVGP